MRALPFPLRKLEAKGAPNEPASGAARTCFSELQIVNKCLTSSNKKLLETSASLLVTSALLVVTRSYKEQVHRF